MSGTVGCTSQSTAARAPVMGSSSLVGLDVRRLGDLRPGGPPPGYLRPGEHPPAEPRVELQRGIAEGKDGEMADLIRKLRRIPPRANIGRQFVEDRRGHAGRRNQGVEGDDIEARIGFGDGGNLWRIAETLAAGPRD